MLNDFSSEELRKNDLFNSNLLLVVLGLFCLFALGWFLGSVSNLDAQLKENEFVYSYFVDANGVQFFDFNRLYCANARLDDSVFCFSGFSINGLRLNFVVPSDLDSDLNEFDSNGVTGVNE